jgi:hypothetical protein
MLQQSHRIYGIYVLSAYHATMSAKDESYPKVDLDMPITVAAPSKAPPQTVGS